MAEYNPDNACFPAQIRAIFIAKGQNMTQNEIIEVFHKGGSKDFKGVNRNDYERVLKLFGTNIIFASSVDDKTQHSELASKMYDALLNRRFVLLSYIVESPFEGHVVGIDGLRYQHMAGEEVPLKWDIRVYDPYRPNGAGIMPQIKLNFHDMYLHIVE